MVFFSRFRLGPVFLFELLIFVDTALETIYGLKISIVLNLRAWHLNIWIYLKPMCQYFLVSCYNIDLNHCLNTP